VVDSASYQSGTAVAASVFTIAATTHAPAVTDLIIFTIGSTNYSVNGQVYSMDTAPIISGGRTLVPISYVANALGATVGWNQGQQMVTVTLNGTTIELWIGQANANINGVTPIDSSDPSVAPVVVPPGRTMMPLRFIAENLDCQVGWNGATQQVTVTYPKP
jgi:hypothetical protein